MGTPGCENREESILKNNYQFSWTLRSQLQGTGRTVISTNTPQKRKRSDCDHLGGKHEACSRGEG